MPATTEGSVDVTSAVAAADELEANGQYLEAAKALSVLPNDRRPPVVDVRIVRLRHLAFADLVPAPPPAPEPDPPPDLFEGIVGPPDVPAADLTPAVLGSAIYHHGCVIGRGLIPEARSARMRADIDRAFDAFDRRRAGATLAETAPWYRPLDAEYGQQLDPVAEVFLYVAGGIYGGSSPRAFHDYLDILTEAGLIDLVREHLGEPPVLSLNKCVLRRISGGAEDSWHQDASYLGVDIRAVNLWMSLSHCGGDTDTMGLDILPRRLHGLAPMGTHSALVPRAVASEEVAVLAQNHPVVRPEFHPGDGMLFDHVFLHRSDVRPLPTVRYAIESWFFAPSTYPANQVPIVVV